MPTDLRKTLPKGWKWVKLGEEKVVQIIMGQSPPSSSYNAEGIGLPFYQGKAEFGEHHPKTVKWCSQPGKIAEADDILMSVRAPVGDVNICKEKSCIGRGLVAIRINRASLNNKFLYYFLKRDTSIWNKLSTGSTFDSITSKTLQSLPIPLPPLPTQHKIVEILEEADNLRKLRQQADEKMKDLIPSLFIQMFGDPAVNPKEWKVRTIGDVCSKNTGIRNPSDFANGYFQYVDISSIDNITGVITTARTILNIDAPSRARKVIKSNDVLVSTVRPNLNAVAVVPNELDDQICSTGFCVLRVSSETSNHHYIYAITRSKYFIETMTKKTQGASYPAISDRDIFNFTIPLPPLPLQLEFAKLVEDIEAEKARQTESKKKLDELFQSLMHRAFTGELVA